MVEVANCYFIDFLSDVEKLVVGQDAINNKITLEQKQSISRCEVRTTG